MSRKTKTVKCDLLTKGRKQSYESVLMSTMADVFARLSCYKDGDYGEAYFEPDHDYEVIVRPKK